MDYRIAECLFLLLPLPGRPSFPTLPILSLSEKLLLLLKLYISATSPEKASLVSLKSESGTLLATILYQGTTHRILTLSVSCV